MVVNSAVSTFGNSTFDCVATPRATQINRFQMNNMIVERRWEMGEKAVKETTGRSHYFSLS